MYWKRFGLMLSIPAANTASLAEIYNSLKSKLEDFSLKATSEMKALQQHELHRQFDVVRVSLTFDSTFNLVDQSGFFFPNAEYATLTPESSSADAQTFASLSSTKCRPSASCSKATKTTRKPAKSSSSRCRTTKVASAHQAPPSSSSPTCSFSLRRWTAEAFLSNRAASCCSSTRRSRSRCLTCARSWPSPKATL